MFLANISGFYTYKKVFGSKIDKIEKCICGCFCVGLILFFIVGPFLMFSNLSFIASENLVVDATMDFGITIIDNDLENTYKFPLFSASDALSIDTFTEDEFIK